jgi:hypothetical protein
MTKSFRQPGFSSNSSSPHITKKSAYKESPEEKNLKEKRSLEQDIRNAESSIHRHKLKITEEEKKITILQKKLELVKQKLINSQYQKK